MCTSIKTISLQAADIHIVESLAMCSNVFTLDWGDFSPVVLPG